MTMMRFMQGEQGIGEYEDLDDVRVGVVPATMNRIDYSGNSPEIRLKEKLLLGGVTGISEKDIVMLNQVHGDDIIVVEEYPGENIPALGDADGMITALTDLCLVIRTADCVPVFIVDRERRVLGAAHSGWRGCRLDITGKLAGMMKEHCACDPANMEAFILPAIGPESYRVNDDVARFFPDDTITREDGAYVDLWKNVAASLRAAGLATVRIHLAGICTLGDRRYFSHRRGDAGRNLNFAYLCNP